MHQDIHEYKIDVEGLDYRMFVIRLDRPWLDTPFTTQSFKISKMSEIEALQQCCKHVYIDTRVGTKADPQFIIIEKDPVTTPEIEALRVRDYTDLTPFKEAIPKAERVQHQVNEQVKDVISDIRQGQKIDIHKMKEGVKAMVDCIVHNPSSFVWVNQLKDKDHYTYHHALGTSIWAASFGRFLGLEQEDLERLALGGLMCDIGKAKLPDDLLQKDEHITTEEKNLFRAHVNHSILILNKAGGVDHDIMRMVASHHEHHDGSGYPLGLKGNDIPIFGRIASIVDSYDAMVSIRPYKDTRSPHEAIHKLYKLRGIKYQSELVEQFIQSCGVYPTGALVELSTGEVGVVTELNSLRRLRPVVMVLLDRDKKPMGEFKSIDLSWGTYDDINIENGLPSGSYGLNMDNLFL